MSGQKEGKNFSVNTKGASNLHSHDSFQLRITYHTVNYTPLQRDPIRYGLGLGNYIPRLKDI